MFDQSPPPGYVPKAWSKHEDSSADPQSDYDSEAVGRIWTALEGTDRTHTRSSEELASATGIPYRTVISHVGRARQHGWLIGTGTRGKGYYRLTDESGVLDETGLQETVAGLEAKASGYVLAIEGLKKGARDV